MNIKQIISTFWICKSLCFCYVTVDCDDFSLHKEWCPQSWPKSSCRTLTMNWEVFHPKKCFCFIFLGITKTFWSPDKVSAERQNKIWCKHWLGRNTATVKWLQKHLRMEFESSLKEQSWTWSHLQGRGKRARGFDEHGITEFQPGLGWGALQAHPAAALPWMGHPALPQPAQGPWCWTEM